MQLSDWQKVGKWLVRSDTHNGFTVSITRADCNYLYIEVIDGDGVYVDGKMVRNHKPGVYKKQATDMLTRCILLTARG